MNYSVVPEFEMDDDYANITSAIFNTSKKSTIGDEEIMELIWQNGQIIMQRQNQRSVKTSHLFSEQSAVEESVAASAPVYMQEDEMASLLQSPPDDSSFDDFLYITPTSAAVTSAAAPPGRFDTTPSCAAVGTIVSSPRPIIPQLRCTEGELPHRLQNFENFSRFPGEAIIRNGTKSSSGQSVRASTIVDSNETPLEASPEYLISRVSNNVTPISAATSAAAPPGEIDTTPSCAAVGTIASSPRPIIPQLRCTEGELPHRLQNSEHFSRFADEAILRNSTSGESVRASTIVDSNETPAAAVTEYLISRVSDNVTPISDVNVRGRETVAPAEVTTACELTLTSSPSASGGSVTAGTKPSHKEAAHAAADDRKRKVRGSDDNEGQSEDVGFEFADARKQVRSSTSAKKSRAAEVHNLSERKRRDRINEKMKALQELIPCCNKSDKASMLDEAIEYLKSLQLQVQMMSARCSMVPMMYPGIPQYMPTMGMNMGMGMNMEMGMNRPMVPYPPLMAGPAVRNAAAAAQMVPQYPLPAYHLPPFPAPDPSRIPVANRTDHLRLNSLVRHNINQPRLPNFSDPYHQHFVLQQAQLMLPQNRRVEQPDSSKPNSCIEGSTGNHQSG